MTTPEPSTERIAELLELWNEKIYPSYGQLRNPDEYTAWDGLIEVDEIMTYEEWEWCSRHFRVDVDVKVWLKDLVVPSARVQLDPIPLEGSDLQFVYDADDDWCSLQDPEATACGAVTMGPVEARQAIRLLERFLVLVEG